MITVSRTQLIFAAIFLFLIFGLGVFFGKTGIAQKAYRKIFPQPENLQNTPGTIFLDSVGLKDRIRIKNEQDVVTYRNILIEAIWGKEGIPYNSLPDSIIPDIKDSLFIGFKNLKRVDCLIDSLEYGFASTIFHLIPENNDRNETVIYHHGHEGEDYSAGIPTYKLLVENGFHVISIHMPLKGRNNSPEINTSTTGRMKKLNHDILMFLERPYPLFFTPIRTSINYIIKDYQIDKFSMVGLSGGGWSTQLYTAMDTDVLKSYSIAGSTPIEIKLQNFEDLGDLEQYDPRIYSKISYPEIYILGSIGPGRRRIQILNKYDPCCFKSDNADYFKKPVLDIVASLGSGYYSFVVDTTHHDHKISRFAREIILNDLLMP